MSRGTAKVGKCERCSKRRKLDARELANGVRLLCRQCQEKVAAAGWRGLAMGRKR